MGFLVESRWTDSPFVEMITQGCTAGAGAVVRPAETQWHMVFVREHGHIHAIIAGPLTTAGVVSFQQGAEILWIKFKPGVFMPHLPFDQLRDCETRLPEGVGHSFWLKSSTWQWPTFDNVETFIDQLARQEILVCDPIVPAVLQDQPHDLAPRTVRLRFQRATGLTQKQIQQITRAQQAAKRLQEGASILDTVFEAGYYDQPHLTRALRQWVGYTPAQLLHAATASAAAASK